MANSFIRRILNTLIIEANSVSMACFDELEEYRKVYGCEAVSKVRSSCEVSRHPIEDKNPKIHRVDSISRISYLHGFLDGLKFCCEIVKPLCYRNHLLGRGDDDV